MRKMTHQEFPCSSVLLAGFVALSLSLSCKSNDPSRPETADQVIAAAGDETNDKGENVADSGDKALAPHLKPEDTKAGDGSHPIGMNDDLGNDAQNALDPNDPAVRTDPTRPAEQTAKSLVWCFELTSRLASAYDATGLCEGFGSIWKNQSSNNAIDVKVKSFDPDHSNSPRPGIAGVYDFSVSFPQDGKTCQFEAKLSVAPLQYQNRRLARIIVAPLCK